MRRRDLVGMRPMLVQHPKHRLAVYGKPGKGSYPSSYASGLKISLAGHHSRDRSRIPPAGVGIIGKPQRHEQGTEIGITQAQFAEGMRVRSEEHTSELQSQSNLV